MNPLPFRGRRPKRTNRTAGATTGGRLARQSISPGRVVKTFVIPAPVPDSGRRRNDAEIANHPAENAATPGGAQEAIACYGNILNDQGQRAGGGGSQAEKAIQARIDAAEAKAASAPLSLAEYGGEHIKWYARGYAEGQIEVYARLAARYDRLLEVHPELDGAIAPPPLPPAMAAPK